MNFRKTVFATAAMIALPQLALAGNTIVFNGEVTNQTCSAVVGGNTDPTIMLDSVPASELTGAVGKTAGETTFTLQLTGCAAPGTGTTENFKTLFQATNPTSSGNLANTAAQGATGVALQLLSAPGGSPVKLLGGTAVAAGNIVLASGQTSASHDYAVQYIAESASVTTGPVLGSVIYTLRYE